MIGTSIWLSVQYEKGSLLDDQSDVALQTICFIIFLIILKSCTSVSQYELGVLSCILHRLALNAILT